MDQILSRCLSRLERGDTVEACLARYPERRDELEPMLRAARRLMRAPRVTPSRSFQRGARSRLMEAIESRNPVARKVENRQQEVPGPPASRIEEAGILRKARKAAAKGESRPRRPGLRALLPGKPDWLRLRRLATPALVAVSVLVVLGVLGIGAARASSESLPGDPMYKVKLATERARLALSMTETGDAHLYLQFARHRLEEAERAAERGRIEQVELAMNGYVQALKSTRDILFGQRASRQAMMDVSEELRAELVHYRGLLTQVEAQAGPEARDAVERAVAATEDVEANISEPTEEMPPERPAPQEPSEKPTAPPPPRSDPIGRPPGGTGEPARPESSEPLVESDTPGPPKQTPQAGGRGEDETPRRPGWTEGSEPRGAKPPDPPSSGLPDRPGAPGRENGSSPSGETETDEPGENSDAPGLPPGNEPDAPEAGSGPPDEKPDPPANGSAPPNDKLDPPVDTSEPPGSNNGATPPGQDNAPGSPH